MGDRCNVNLTIMPKDLKKVEEIIASSKKELEATAQETTSSVEQGMSTAQSCGEALDHLPGHLGELRYNLGQRPRHPIVGHVGARPGSSPVAIGTRTMLPHSVQDPS